MLVTHLVSATSEGSFRGKAIVAFARFSIAESAAIMKVTAPLA